MRQSFVLEPFELIVFFADFRLLIFESFESILDATSRFSFPRPFAVITK